MRPRVAGQTSRVPRIPGQAPEGSARGQHNTAQHSAAQRRTVVWALDLAAHHAAQRQRARSVRALVAHARRLSVGAAEQHPRLAKQIERHQHVLRKKGESKA